MSVLGRVGKRTFNFADVIGKGGEATVYRHPSDATVAARFYHDARRIDVARIQHMLGNEPQPTVEHGLPCFGWPLDIITDPTTGHIIGTLLRFAPEVVPLSQVVNPGYRLGQITTPWLSHVAHSLSYRVYSAAWQDYLICDWNPENFLVDRNGSVCAIDCEAYQFRVPNGKPNACGLGVPEYMAPEQLAATGPLKATRESVVWSLMVLVHMLLRRGEHPFASANTSPRLLDRVRQGLWPDSGSFVAYPPPRAALPFAQLPTEFQSLCRRTFGDGHGRTSMRPSLVEIVQVLDKLLGAKAAIPRSAWSTQFPQTRPNHTVRANASSASQAPGLTTAARRHLRRTQIRYITVASFACVSLAVASAWNSSEQEPQPTNHQATSSRPASPTQVVGDHRPTPALWKSLRETP